EVDELAIKADFRFRELAQEWDDSLDEKDLENEFKSFIQFSGGTIDKKEIAKAKEKLKLKGKAEKISTYQLTKELVLKKMSIDEREIVKAKEKLKHKGKAENISTYQLT